jgi:hypothetical protein
VSEIALPGARSAGFQTRHERRFTSGRFGGIGYTAGLEIWAAGAKSLVHRHTIISRAKVGRVRLDCPSRGAVLPRPATLSLSGLIVLRLAAFSIPHGQGLIHIVAELGLPTE